MEKIEEMNNIDNSTTQKEEIEKIYKHWIW